MSDYDDDAMDSQGEEDIDDEEMQDDYEDEEEDIDTDADGDAYGFTKVVPDRDIKKVYEIDFKAVSVEEIIQFQNQQITHVAGILGCLEEHAATLLRHFRWNKERLIEKYMETPEDVCASAGVILDEHTRPKCVVVPGFMCDICCNDEVGLESLALQCGHRFCRDCYSHYLNQKIGEEGESRRIQCMMNGCKVIVDENTIGLLASPQVNQKYHRLLVRTYVDDNEFYRWCPAPGCEYAINAPGIPQSGLREVVPTVKCKCGTTFCFGCGLSFDHQPAICEITKKWLQKNADDSETANWIHANTKECTKCGSTIEKNGGCNHMTCKKCAYEFCWVCMGPWQEHGTSWYNCNRFDEKTSVDARDTQAKSRQALERYLHYYNRYANHEQSAKLDKELYEKTEKKMDEMQQSSELSWIEVQFLRQAVAVLLQSRATLKWTYAFAYYLTRNNQTELFEDNQRDLEMAVEHLSHLLEKPIEPEKIAELKQQVLDRTQYVSMRREVLLTDTCKGLQEGRWIYNIELRR